MKRFFSILLLICVLVCPLGLVSCGNDTVFSLGPYEINEDHYRYLASMYNRQIFVSNGIDGSSWEATIPTTGYTVADTVDARYTDSFLTSIYTLLYSQLLFDVYNLEMPQSMIDTINSNVDTVVRYYGPYSEQKFDQMAKKSYGFTAKTMREVYIMQMKQTLVIEHLFGADGEKISDETLNEIYEKNYMCFQTLVINDTFKLVKELDDEGNEVEKPEDLTDDEVKERQDIIDDLTNLFIDNDSDYVYKVIDPTMSYEKLYTLYSDDKAHPQGCYSTFPSSASSQNAITAAALLKENDVAKVIAKRTFTQDQVLEIGDKSITINAGDYFEYGYVFVKRLPLGERAYDNEAYETFFEDFIDSAKSQLFAEHLADYEANEASYSLKDHGIASEIPLSSVTPNNLDYNFIYGELSKGEEETSN